MINRILILLLLTLFLYNKGRACSCEFTSYEFDLNQYDGATHVFIAEIKEENPESIVEKVYKNKGKIGLKKREYFLSFTYYTLEISEIFKGDLSNLAHIEQENQTSCSGLNLKKGEKYLFYMYSNDQQPTSFKYNLCTPIEKIKFNAEANIPKDKEHIKSLIQQHTIQILRELKEINTDTITIYFSGYYLENDSLKKEDQKINFRGAFKEGKKSGYWEVYQPRTNAILKKKKNTFNKPIVFGRYSEGLKIGVWSKYYYDVKSEKWILTEEDYSD